MNRSFSSSFRTNNSHKSNKTFKNQQPTVGFQTLFKSRNGHAILRNFNPNLVKKSKSSQQPNIQDKQKIQNAQPIDEDLRSQYNKVNHDQTSEEKKGRENSSQIMFRDKQPKNYQSQLVKSHSQPKLGKKKTFFQKMETFSIISNLQQLQKKVSQLLQLKLIKKTQNKNLFNFGIDEDDLQKDLQMLVAQIQEYRTQKQDDGINIQAQIRQLGKKILIIESIIAESFTQSQILKKYYFLKKLSKKSINLYQNKIFRQAKPLQMKNFAYNPQFPSMHFSTIAQTSFAKFDKEAYIKQPKANNNYNSTRHPLTRSSYQAHYLSYGSLPTYPPKTNTDVSTFNLSQNKPSTYQTDFTQKKVNLIDSKQLDCRRDKFKPTQITYMPKKMLGWKQNQNDQSGYKSKTKTKKKMAKKNFQFESSKNILPVQSYARFYKGNSQIRFSQYPSSCWMKSEYNSNFQGQKAIIECLAKQTNLTNLKYQFRKNFNA